MPSRSLPQLDEAVAVPLKWAIFDAGTGLWADLPQQAVTSDRGTSNNRAAAANSPLSLVTWNIDAHAYEPVARLRRLLEAIYRQCSRAGPTDTAPRKESDTPDVIFLQEVASHGKHVPEALLENPWVRSNYYVSGASWIVRQDHQHHPCFSLTLVSRHRFEVADLGPLWRIDLPSRFGRYALCCDLGQPASSACSRARVYRLINVHLDRGAVRPNKRPLQMQVIAQALKAQGTPISGGIVAGDFCPVIPEEDDEIVPANGLVDCWSVLQPGQEGNTWVPKARESYPPCRMDKIAITRAGPGDTGPNDHLTPRSIEVLRPGMLKQVPLGGPQGAANVEVGTPYLQIPWSNHCGLYATFTLSTD